MIMEFTFYPYTEKNVLKVEKRWGVYKLADMSKRILFIGRGNIRKHLIKHLPDGEAPAEEAEFFMIEYYESGDEAKEAWEEMLENYENKFGSLPKYNQ